jgi:hypothetical protein
MFDKYHFTTGECLNPVVKLDATMPRVEKKPPIIPQDKSNIDC